jgi:hypothetical protein
MSTVFIRSRRRFNSLISVYIGMQINYSEEEFLKAKSKDKLNLICKHCNNQFGLSKREVKKAIKRKRGGLFCSKICCLEFVKVNGAIVEQKKKERLLFSCKQCGTQILKKQSEIRGQANIFCSHHCSARHQRGNAFGPQMKLVCQFCSTLKPVNEKTYQKFLTTQEFFCQHDCKVNNYRKISKEKNTQLHHTELKKGDITNCPECQKEFMIKERKPTKHGKRYCSKSCRMRHFNLHYYTYAQSNSSYPENYLFSLLTAEFPNLNIQKNNRTFLQRGLELDIFIPQLNLAIEINGPVHYKPIFGEERLADVKQKDQIKILELRSKQVQLIVLNVSELTKLHAQQSFIENEFSNIKILINKLLS